MSQLIAEDAASYGLPSDLYEMPAQSTEDPGTPAGVDDIKQASPASTTTPMNTPAVEPLIDPRFAKLREQALEAQKLLSEAKEREARATEVEQKFVGAKSLNDKLKLLGFSKIDDLLEEYAKTGGESTPENEKLSAIDKKLADLAQRERQRDEQQAREAQQAHEQRLMSDIETHIKGNPDFELLQEPTGISDVHRAMQAHYENTRDPVTGRGEVLPIADAVKYVNKLYEDNLQRLLKYAKVQKMLGVSPGDKLPPPASAARQQSAPIKTITSAVRGGATPAAEMSDDELFADVTARLQKAMQQDRQRR